MGEFTTTLAGAKYRQAEILKAIKWMTKGSVTIYLEPEPENPHDPNAVRVDAEQEGKPRTRTKIGYLPAHVAENARDQIDDLQVTDVEVRMPDEDFDFWNLRFAFANKKASTQRKVVKATAPYIPDEPHDGPVKQYDVSGTMIVWALIVVVGIIWLFLA